MGSVYLQYSRNTWQQLREPIDFVEPLSIECLARKPQLLQICKRRRCSSPTRGSGKNMGRASSDNVAAVSSVSTSDKMNRSTSGTRSGGASKTSRTVHVDREQSEREKLEETKILLEADVADQARRSKVSCAQELAAQRAQYEQQINSLAAANTALEDRITQKDQRWHQETYV